MTRPIDCEFYLPQVPVCIASVFADARALSLRAQLEGLGCVVHLSRPGTPADFLKLIGQGQSIAPYLIILGHGTPDGIHFGSYGPPDIDTALLRNECLPPESIRLHANVPGCTVISATCHGGSPAMAEAFLAGGARTYIGCDTSVPGAPMNLFVSVLLYRMIGSKLAPAEALEAARTAVGHPTLEAIRCFNQSLA